MSRLSHLLSGGRHIANVAVLWPTNAMSATYTPQTHNPIGDRTERDFNTLTDLLLRLHYDYDYLDEDRPDRLQPLNRQADDREDLREGKEQKGTEREEPGGDGGPLVHPEAHEPQEALLEPEEAAALTDVEAEGAGLAVVGQVLEDVAEIEAFEVAAEGHLTSLSRPGRQVNSSPSRRCRGAEWPRSRPRTRRRGT